MIQTNQAEFTQAIERLRGQKADREAERAKAERERQEQAALKKEEGRRCGQKWTLNEANIEQLEMMARIKDEPLDRISRGKIIEKFDPSPDFKYGFEEGFAEVFPVLWKAINDEA